MNKLLLPILCLGLTVWLFGGSYWFGNQYAKSSSDNSWTLQDGSVKFSSPTTFSYQKSDPEIFLDDNQHAMIADMAQYLGANPLRHLELIGLYTEQEINNSDYKNLGLARAESLRYLLYRQGVPLEQLNVYSKLIKAHKLNSNGLINGGVDFQFTESPLAKYGSAFSLIKEIQFEANNTTQLTNPDFEDYIAALRQYMVDFPDKKIHLTGYSKSVDQNTITRKRVYHLRKKLTDIGIPIDKLNFTLEQADSQNEVNSFVEIKVF